MLHLCWPCVELLLITMKTFDPGGTRERFLVARDCFVCAREQGRFTLCMTEFQGNNCFKCWSGFPLEAAFVYLLNLLLL